MYEHGGRSGLSNGDDDRRMMMVVMMMVKQSNEACDPSTGRKIRRWQRPRWNGSAVGAVGQPQGA